MSAGNCGNLAVIGWQVPSGRMRVPVVPSGLRKRVVEARGGRQPKLHRPERTLILATEDGLQPNKPQDHQPDLQRPRPNLRDQRLPGDEAGSH